MWRSASIVYLPQDDSEACVEVSEWCSVAFVRGEGEGSRHVHREKRICGEKVTAGEVL